MENEIVVGYFEKLKLATMIKEEIKKHYLAKEKTAPYKSDAHKTTVVNSPAWGGDRVVQFNILSVKSIHGILEKNLKVVEIEDGFEVHVPAAYGEQYINDCIKSAINKWKKELQMKAKVSEEWN